MLFLYREAGGLLYRKGIFYSTGIYLDKTNKVSMKNQWGGSIYEEKISIYYGRIIVCSIFGKK